MLLGSPRPSPRSDIRLQKYLASCGLGSRRACEKLIDQGLVSVDGEVVSRQGTTVDPDCQEVRVQGRRVVREPFVHVLLHKPRGVLCTSHDPEGRPTIHALLPSGLGRVYTVGRLDRDSEGLLVVTNDGALAHALTHPRHQVTKVYQVWLDDFVTGLDCRCFVEGLSVDGESLRVVSIEPWRRDRREPVYRVVLAEGRNRQVRRMMAARGRTVKRLRRVALGSLRLGSVPLGQVRPLSSAEVERLGKEAGLR